MGYKKGLEGIIAAETEIGFIDGEQGKLVYRGEWAKDLAINKEFEEVAYLIWYGKLPNKQELEELKSSMKKYRGIPDYIHSILENLPEDMDFMSVLRTCISALGTSKFSWPPTVEQAIQITSIAPTIIAYWYRKQQNKSFVEPDLNLDHVENYLYMIKGNKPEESHTKALTAYLILTIEHGMNASTFSARVVISTESELISAITAAIGAMKGPLHGGAPSGVIKMLEEIGNKNNIESWVKNSLEKGEKLMGFGHRVYKTRDPRAEALKIVSKQLTGQSEWLELALELEDKAIKILNEYKPGRKLYTNVEFYAAAVLKGISLPQELFTPTFTASRIVGWTGHAIEQSKNNRIFRPASKYVGKSPSNEPV